MCGSFPWLKILCWPRPKRWLLHGNGMSHMHQLLPSPSAPFCGIPVVMTGTALAVTPPIQSPRQPCTLCQSDFQQAMHWIRLYQLLEVCPVIDRASEFEACLSKLQPEPALLPELGALCVLESCQPQNRISKICHAAKIARLWESCLSEQHSPGQSWVCLSGVWHSQPITPKHCLYPPSTTKPNTPPCQHFFCLWKGWGALAWEVGAPEEPCA